FPGSAGSGICFTHTTTFMACHAAPLLGRGPNRYLVSDRSVTGREGKFPGAVKVLLLVNSVASSVTPRSRVVIGKALSADHDVPVAETSPRGHAPPPAPGARGAGGAGTLNEAANGLAGTATALAPLPGGSTNVFARTIGLPNDPIEATGVLLDPLARHSIRRVGLGSVNGRYFLFHTGVGFDAAVVEQVERRSALK